MKKIELLSPVGNKESLMQAIHNGADAIYLAGKSFGARKYADNFNNKELISAIKYCHLYDVKIYITVNTIIYNDEIDEFLDYIDFLINNNVDALIMQDIGMIKKVRILYPEVEIHASTQMHNTTKEEVELLNKLGIKRVVFARELSLNEIKKIDIDIEKEVFIHGALCVSYSGCCLFSSMKGSRSGNRGKCVGSCRLKYDLVKNDKIVKVNGNYLLSTKELNTIDSIDKLIEADITSLKIEGRMKSPEYVGFITKIYRTAIDSYYDNKKYILTEEEIKSMMLLYNRQYTKGFLFNEKPSDLMNIKTPNHQGIKLGKTIYIDDRIIKIKLNETINQEDGIRFINDDKGMIVNKLYNEKMLLVNEVKKGSIAIVDNKVNIKENTEVIKTIDKKLLLSLNKINYKKITVDFDVEALLNKELLITISDGTNVISEKGNMIEQSINSPISKENIVKQLTKLGDTPFIVNNININMSNNIFISLKELNEIRRVLTTKLISLRENKVIINNRNIFSIKNKKSIIEKQNINVKVRNELQLKASIDSNIDNIYVTDYDLYMKYKDKNVYLVLDRVMNSYKNFNYENLLVRETGSIGKYNKNNNLIGDYTLNIVNNESVNILNDLNVKRICLSPEVSINRLKYFDKFNLEYIIYGRIELMITKYCPLNLLLNKENKCNLCRENNKYFLKKDNDLFPIISNNSNHITTIFDSKNINYMDEIDEIKKYINNIRIDLFDENYEETIKIIKEVKKKL